MTDEIKQAVEKVKKQAATPVTSAVLPDGSLAEMVYRPEENRTLFCVLKENGFRYETNLLVNSERLVPYSPPARFGVRIADRFTAGARRMRTLQASRRVVNCILQFRKKQAESTTTHA